MIQAKLDRNLLKFTPLEPSNFKRKRISRIGENTFWVLFILHTVYVYLFFRDFELKKLKKKTTENQLWMRFNTEEA